MLTNSSKPPLLVRAGFPACGVAVSGILLLATWLCVYRPLQQRGEQLKADIAQAEHLLAKGLEHFAQQKQLAQQIELAAARHEQLDARVPEELNEAAFLKQVTSLADQTRVVLRDYRPGQIAVQSRYRHQQIHLEIEGSYEELCTFLTKLKHLPRLCVLDLLKIEPIGGTTTRCRVKTQLRIFSTLPTA